MAVDVQTERNMLLALNNNFCYTPGERVALLEQQWKPSLAANERGRMDRASLLVDTLVEIYTRAGIRGLTRFSYVPSAPGSTVEPPADVLTRMSQLRASLGSPSIILAPTAYSLTHTDFLKRLAGQGSRIGTLSDASIDMFVSGGPFDSRNDIEKMAQRTEMIADSLRGVQYVGLHGPNVDLTMHINPSLVHSSTGLITRPGMIRNWLGAEAYVVPVDPREGGTSHGWFIVDKGFGGIDPFEGRVKFTINEGRFTDVSSIDGCDVAAVRKRIFGSANRDVVAELGFGTNAAISPEYLSKHWAIVVAEKMYGSDNARTVHVAAGNSSGMGGINHVPYHEDFLIRDVREIDLIR